MKYYILLGCVWAMAFTSCQKGIVWDDLNLNPAVPTTPTTPGTSTGNLLVKTVSLSVTDTVTELYTYDTSVKLIKTVNVGFSSGSKTDNRHFLVRDASGRITQHTQIIYSNSSSNASGYDTVVANIHYPSSSSNYDYTTQLQNSMGHVVKDSSTFAYTNGKVVTILTYQTNFVTGIYQPLTKYTYGYDANGNVTSGKAYSYASGSSAPPTLGATFTFEYDAKNSPLILGNDAFIVVGETFAGPNNCIKLTSAYSGPPAQTLTLAYNYSYNNNNYPSIGIATTTYQGTTTSTTSTTGTFYYQ